MTGDVSVYKDKNQNYVAQVTIGTYENGRRKYKRFKGEKKKDVIERANEFQIEYFGKEKDDNDFFLEDYLRKYFKDVKTGALKPTSFTRENTTLEKHIVPYIGFYQMNQLNPDLIQTELINRLLDKGYSYSTIHKVYTFLNSALAHAERKGDILKNPCSLVKEPSKKIFPQKPARFLDDDEISLFVEEAKNPKYKNGFAIATIIYTGLRGGELCALQWKDIDFEEKTITIDKNVAFYYQTVNGIKKRVVSVQHSTKNSEIRVVPLTQKAADLFLAQKEKSKDRISSDFVLLTDKPLSVDVISGTYSTIAENAGIKNPSGIHTLRHTFCSLLIRKNVDIKTVSELAGHKNVAFTYNTYVHIIKKQKVKAIELLDL